MKPEKVDSVMSSPVVAVRPTDTVAHAKNQMLRHGVGRLVVMEKGKPVGMLSMHDVAEHFSRGAPEWRRRQIDQIPIGRVMHKGLITVSMGTGLGNAARLMLRHGISSLVVLEDGDIAGMVTKTDLARHFAGQMRGMSRVDALMTKNPVVVNRGHSIARVVELMEEFGVARVVVVVGDRPIGIISESDVGFARMEEPGRGIKEREVRYTRKLERGARPMARYVKQVALLTAEDIMHSDIITVAPESDAAEAAGLMLRHGISGLPVVKKEKLEGILTKTDLVKEIGRLYHEG
ncbi:MAG: CBS domain-containing protein [Candidatus Hadarchaeota archaeon]